MPKRVWQSEQVYRGLRNTRGLATLRDVWRFAAWVGDRLKQNIVIDGVERARVEHLDAPDPYTSSARTGQSPTERPQYRFKRRRGLALVADLAVYSTWLSQRMEASATSAGLKITLMTAKQGPLPLPNRQGVLKRHELMAFIRGVGARLGFGVEGDDIVGFRDTGGGLQVRRRPYVVQAGALQLQIEPRTCGAQYCYVAIDGGVAYGQLDYSETYDNGTINYTSTQPDTGPHIYNTETAAHDCASPDNTNDAVEGFDYGDFISASGYTYSDALPAADLLTEALANLVTSGSPSTVGSWTWTPAGGAVTEVFDTLASLDVDVADIAQDLGYWVDLNPADRIVYSWRYRWISASTMPLQLDWTQGGSAQSLELAAGATSDWYDDVISGTAETPDAITDLTIEEL